MPCTWLYLPICPVYLSEFTSPRLLSPHPDHPDPVLDPLLVASLLLVAMPLLLAAMPGATSRVLVLTNSEVPTKGRRSWTSAAQVRLEHTPPDHLVIAVLTVSWVLNHTVPSGCCWQAMRV